MKIRYTIAEKDSDIGRITIKKVVGGSPEIVVYITMGMLTEIFTSYKILKAYVDRLESLVDEARDFHNYAWPDDWKENE